MNPQLDISFHNSINLDDQQLAVADDRARSLEDKVLQMFYTTHRGGIAKIDLIKHFDREYAEISYGRALTNLVYRNKIRKTERMKDGAYGHGNFIYELIKR